MLHIITSDQTYIITCRYNFLVKGSIQDKKNKWAGIQSWGEATSRKKDGTQNNPGRKSNPIREYGVRTNIWRIKNSGGFGQSSKAAYKHPAINGFDARGLPEQRRLQAQIQKMPRGFQ